MDDLSNASVVIQSAIRSLLVRQCSGNVGLLNFSQRKESEEVVVKSSYIAELQRRVLKAEAVLREKDEENEILQQRVRQYESRWSEYEVKMKSMEEVWQKQMRSLQSRLFIAKWSLTVDDSARNSDVSINDEREFSCGTPNGSASCPMTASLSVISRLAEEFEQRR